MIRELNTTEINNFNPAIQELVNAEASIQQYSNEISDVLNKVKKDFDDLQNYMSNMQLIKSISNTAPLFVDLVKSIDDITKPFVSLTSNFGKVKNLFSRKNSNKKDRDDPSNINSVIDLSIFNDLKGDVPELLGPVQKRINKSLLVETISGKIKEVSQKITPKLDMLKSNISYFFETNGLVIKTKDMFAGIQKIINDVITNLNNQIPKIPIFGTLLEKIGEITGASAGAVTLIIGLVALIIATLVSLWQSSEEFRNNVMLAIDNVKLILLSLWEGFLQPLFQAIIDICLNVWKFGLEPLWNAWVQFVGIILNVVLELWNGIAPIFEAIFNILGPIFQAVLDVLVLTVSIAFSTVFSVVATIASSIVGTIQSAVNIIKAVIEVVKSIFIGLIDTICWLFGSNWEDIWNGVVKIFSDIWSGLKDSVTEVLNAVIRIINRGIDAINNFGFTLPDWIPKMGGIRLSLDIPHIPELAQGGIVSKATLGVFGENGTEAVIPLQRNTRGIEMIADKIVANMPKESGNGTYLIQLVLEDGTVLAKKLIKNIKNYEIMTGKPAF